MLGKSIGKLGWALEERKDEQTMENDFSTNFRSLPTSCTMFCFTTTTTINSNEVNLHLIIHSLARVDTGQLPTRIYNFHVLEYPACNHYICLYTEESGT